MKIALIVLLGIFGFAVMLFVIFMILFAKESKKMRDELENDGYYE